MEIFLVRHGQTQANREQRVQGRSDPPLDETGRLQAQRLADRLRSVPVRAVYSSPLRRALQTADAIAAPHALPVTVEPGLIEMDVGALDGLSYAEMREQYGQFLKMWRHDAGAVRMPGGENLREVRERSWPILQQLSERYRDGAAIIVSHAFTLQGLLCKAMDIPLTHFERVRHDVAAITLLAITESGAIVLKSLNDRCHLLAETEDWAD